MSDTQRRIHPLTAAAAVAVILFSAVGVAVMTGAIPSGSSKEASVPSPVAVTEAPLVKPAAPVAEEPAAKPAPAAAKPAPAKHVAPRKEPVQQVAAANEPAPPPPAPAPQVIQTPAAPPAPPPAALCNECGIVDAVQIVEQEGQGSGLGAVAGGVVGGLVGNQFGHGTGRTLATVAGAAGGAYAGHQVEKKVKSGKTWNVKLLMDNGSMRTVTQDTEPSFKPGDRVKVVDGKLAPR